MGTVIWIYTAFFIAGALINLVRSLAGGAKFSRYMEEHHPEKWQQLLYEHLPVKIILWPFMRGNIIDFIWKSEEDYGDPRIKLFRQKMRWAFYGWLIYLAGGALGFAVLGMIAYY